MISGRNGIDRFPPFLYYYVNTITCGGLDSHRRRHVSPERLTVQIHISSTDGVPIYLQIVNQVKYLVASGRLSPGEELPPIRVLAERLLINPNTVARAYRELETAGVVTKRRTAGTYVSQAGSPLRRRERLRILTQRVDALLAEARQMDVATDEILELIRRRDQQMQTGSKQERRHD